MISFRGDRLRERRCALGLTQSALAGLVKVDRNTIIRLEHGGAPPVAETLLRLARAINCSVAYLLGIRETPERCIYPTTKERTLVDAYRALTPSGQAKADDMMQVLLQVQRLETTPENV